MMYGKHSGTMALPNHRQSFEQITYLLFMKMLDDKQREKEAI